MKSIIKNSIKFSGIADNLPDNPYIFKQLNMERTLILPEPKPNILHIVQTSLRVDISKTNLIKIPVITSLKNQSLTGNSLSIEGVLSQKIEYAADVITQMVYATEYTIPFSTFIMLPDDYIIDKSIPVKSYIEDISISLIDERTIFENIILFIDGSHYC